MVRGLEKFREYFKDFKEKYVLIGGTACDLWFADAGAEFRATNDFDVILVVEALDKEFFSVFWQFIKDGGYKDKQNEPKERKYYRFANPADDAYPKQIELFSRIPGGFDLRGNVHLTPVPAQDEFSSLSAIIMDDVFYNFVKLNTSEIGGLSLINIPGLICLKAKAYQELNGRKNNGADVDDRDIRKHRNDVIRLLTIISDENKITVPEEIKKVLKYYLSELVVNPPDYSALQKDLRKKGILITLRSEFIITQFNNIFDL
jgi:hypothetical protein